MKTEPDAMPYDAELLRTLIDDGKFTVKRLGVLTNRDGSTIYRYLQGEKTIPVDVLRAAFEETCDSRILRLITGRVPVNPIVLVAEFRPDNPASAPARIPPITDCMPKTLTAIKAAAQSAEHLAAITADGKFDHTDLQQAAEYERDANVAIEALNLSLAAVAAHKQRIGA